MMSRSFNNIVGMASSRNVFIDGRMLMAEKSQKIRNHSPDGFSWGYGGSGPSQLALAILLELHPEGAQQLYQDFKFDFIAGLPMDKDFSIPIAEVNAWIAKKRGI